MIKGGWAKGALWVGVACNVGRSEKATLSTDLPEIRRGPHSSPGEPPSKAGLHDGLEWGWLL